MLVACVAPGPSLSRLPLERLAGCDHVLAVSRAFEYLPPKLRISAIYACDGRWWDKYHAAAATTGAELWTAHAGAARRHQGLNLARLSVRAPGMSSRRDLIHSGGNSGFQALNLALNLYEPDEIWLVGYDMQAAPDGRQHVFGEYEGSLRVKMPFDFFVEQFKAVPAVVRGARIINCTPGSRLTMFPFRPLEELSCATV